MMNVRIKDGQTFANPNAARSTKTSGASALKRLFGRVFSFAFRSPGAYGIRPGYDDSAAINKRSTGRVEDDVVTRISHELRAPLVLLRDRLQVLQTSIEVHKEPTSIHEISRSLGHIERLERLVEKLRDLTIAEAEAGRLAAREADLATFVRETVQPFSLLAERRRVALCLELPAFPVPAYFDEEKLQIVISNLIDNALKYTPPGGQVRIQLSRDKPAGEMPARAALRVTDTGQGIAVDDIDVVFEALNRLGDSPEGAMSSGMGLGLALVRSLVALHGGQVEIESYSGKGTVVTVWLPLGRAHLSDDHVLGDGFEMWPNTELAGGDGLPESDSPEPPYIQPSMRPHILIIDDNESLCRYLARELGPQYEVTFAFSAAPGYDRIKYERPDAVICDIMMPGEDGLSLLRRLKSDDELRAIPVLMFTALSDDQFRLAGLRAQADAYLVKPVAIEEIRLHLNNLIRSKSTDSVNRWDDDDASAVVDPEQEDREFLSKARNVIHDKMDEQDFDVQRLAESMYVSRRVLERRMKDLTGLSPNLYIRRLRLERAHQMIESRSVRTVAEVATAVGFRDPSYFSRLYRSKEGTSPSTLLHDENGG